MSALGHKRTYAMQQPMSALLSIATAKADMCGAQGDVCWTFAAQNGVSALPPKADMCSALAHVCFVPIADIHEMTCAQKETD